jgi:hypothetical protein
MSKALLRDLKKSKIIQILHPFKLMEKHQDPSSLLALIKVSALIKDTCGMSDVFCEAREFRVTEGACEFKESVARTVDLL